MANCISCLCDNLSEVSDYVYESEIFEKYFPCLTILKCTNCSMVQVDHDSIDNNKLTSYYEDNYRRDVGIATKQASGVSEYLIARGRTLMELSKKYKSIDGAKRILEIGAGYGYNLKQFKKYYKNAEFYADELNKEILPKEVKAGELGNNNYDIVILSHVLEHFVNPVDMLSKAIGSLSTNGILVIEVPNEGGGFIWQSHDGLVFHEPHITFFELHTLGDFIKNNCPNVSIRYIGTCGPLIENEMDKRKSFLVKIKWGLQRLLSKSSVAYGFVHSIKKMFAGGRQNNDYGLSTYSESDNSRSFVRVVLQKN